MIRKIDLKLDFRQDLDSVLRHRFPHLQDYRILSQSLDARGAGRGKPPTFHYQIEIREEIEDQYPAFDEKFPNLGPLETPPLIIGAGPAGLFCALRLVEYGVSCKIFERGDAAEKRMLKISRYWRYGEMDEDSNVCYGEGGAGLFSDGKLMTRIKSPFVQYVMNRLVDFGAPKEVAYYADPHLGSNKIRKLISQITSYLRHKGCEIHYNTPVESLLFEPVQNPSAKEVKGKVKGVQLYNGRQFFSSHIILATGHSAKEMYYHLKENQVSMAPKSFAMGVRIEHSRRYIDSLQYGPFNGDPHLQAARYRLSYHNKATHKGTYSFCMCPGGNVLSSGTDKDGIVTNGMSNFARNSPWSNAALVVTVEAGVDFAKENDPRKVLEGLEWQYSVEKAAFQLSCERATGREIPALSVKEFLDHSLNKNKRLPPTSCPSGLVKAPMEQILPDTIRDHLHSSLLMFERSFSGFALPEAILIAPETRTSSPVTIIRNPQTLESESHQGLYPCGEGAGYAGGITSAAVDGIRVAMNILRVAKGLDFDSTTRS